MSSPTRQLRLARDAGALTVLPLAATYRAGVHVHRGRVCRGCGADRRGGGDHARQRATHRSCYSSLVLAAWRGQEAQASELIEASREDAARRGEGRAVTLAEYATAVLYNGLGRYQAALAAAQRACEHDDLGLFAWSLTELVEAAARSGAPELAGDALERLSRDGPALSGTDWALGVEARSRALLSNGRTAEDLYREAIERLGRCRDQRASRPHPPPLRRMAAPREPADRRPRELRTAHEMFSTMGAEAFAERAARELLATGEKARKRTADTRDQLTAQETQIARACARRPLEPRDRRPAVHQHTDRRVPPAQGVHEAGNQLAQRAPAGAP